MLKTSRVSISASSSGSGPPRMILGIASSYGDSTVLPVFLGHLSLYSLPRQFPCGFYSHCRFSSTWFPFTPSTLSEILQAERFVFVKDPFEHCWEFIQATCASAVSLTRQDRLSGCYRVPLQRNYSISVVSASGAVLSWSDQYQLARIRLTYDSLIPRTIFLFNFHPNEFATQADLQHTRKERPDNDPNEADDTSTSSPPSISSGSASAVGPNANVDSLILTARPLNSRVLIIRLNRPHVLNALSTALTDQLLSALQYADTDPEIGAIVLTGNENAFAAGADIRELSGLKFPSVYVTDYLRGVSEGVSSTKKPVIAAVSGYALGGGLELALACDTIFASTTATFGLPEVKLGTIPGAGGTQRLVRAIGKAKAMNMILTGDTISSDEALSWGLVAKVFTTGQLLDAAVDAGKKMASHSMPIVAMAKDAVLQADQLSLADGIRFERALYHSTFATADFVEGTRAFLEKRPPVWKNA